MTDQDGGTTSSHPDSQFPASWWVRLCRWLWRVLLFVWGTLIVGILVGTLSNLNTTSTETPLSKLYLIHIAALYPLLTSISGGGLLLVTVISWIGSRQRDSTSSLALSQQNRLHMVHRLQRTYDDLLAHSLQDNAWLEIGLVSKPNVIQNTSTLLLRSSHLPERLLPAGTPIEQVYEEAAHELLILGEPGAGKSTLVLKLGQYLVAQAKQDDRQPLPVLLPLSSWAARRLPLQDWLAEQVTEIYDIPQLLAGRWVQDGQLLLLLDGLDEMEETARPACIIAINTFHHEHPGPLLICSRRSEYEEAAKTQRLSLQIAVVVQPISYEHIDAYLVQAGISLDGLRRALIRNTPLRELASTPLMLSVLMLTYQEKSVHLASQKEVELLHHVWTDYVQRMIDHKQQSYGKQYTLEQTRSWLGWLAQQMRTHNQTIFYAERLQEDWLSNQLRLVYSWLAIRFIDIMIGVLVSLLVWLFFDGSNFSSLLLAGFVGGLMGGCLSQAAGTVFTFARFLPRKISFLPFSVVYLGSSLILGALFGVKFGGAVNGAPITATDNWFWLRDGIIYGIGFGLSGWMFSWSLRISRSSDSSLTRSAYHRIFGSHRFPSIHLRRAAKIALIGGIIFGLSNGLRMGVNLMPGFRLNIWQTLLVSFGLMFARTSGEGAGQGFVLSTILSYGLSFGCAGFLLSIILENKRESFHLAEHLSWNGSHLIRSEHLRISILLASLFVPIFGLIQWINATQFFTPTQWFGQSLGPTLSEAAGSGLSQGFIFALMYWLLFGLYQGIIQKQVEAKDRRTFNQGIRRSLRNGIFISLLSGGITAGLGILSQGLILGLTNGIYNGIMFRLSFDLNNALGFAWLFAFGGGLLVWMLVGGRTVIRHYVIRLLLAHNHTFPWQAQAFLEDATSRVFLQRVGGGYRFIHRLLLDYFANQDLSASSISTHAQPTKPSRTENDV